MGNFIIQDEWKTKNKMGECCPELHITDPSNKRAEETSTKQRIMEMSFEGGQGPEEAAVP